MQPAPIQWEQGGFEVSQNQMGGTKAAPVYSSAIQMGRKEPSSPFLFACSQLEAASGSHHKTCKLSPGSTRGGNGLGGMLGWDEIGIGMGVGMGWGWR